MQKTNELYTPPHRVYAKRHFSIKSVLSLLRGAPLTPKSGLVVLRGAFFGSKNCTFSKRSVFLLRGACFQTCQNICVFTCNPSACSKPCCFIVCPGRFFPWVGHGPKHIAFYSESVQMRVFRVRGALLGTVPFVLGRCFLDVFSFGHRLVQGVAIYGRFVSPMCHHGGLEMRPNATHKTTINSHP